MGGSGREDLEVIRSRLVDFAGTYPDLTLYRRICEATADDAEVASLLTAASPGQARPVLLLAALHDLVLRRPEVAAARWFARAREGSLTSADDPWPDARATLLANAAELRTVIAGRSTQTNEVNRAVYVAALLCRAAHDAPAAPVALLEPGCSAGLLLAVDRYRVELDGGRSSVVLGSIGSPVRCRGEVTVVPGADPASRPEGWRLPPIVERVGLDLAPVSLDDPDEVRWLEACTWPDRPERTERLRAAVGLVRPDPPVVVAGDMVDDLAATAHAARAVAAATVGPDAPPVHLVVVTSWSLTYLRRDRRAEVAAALADLAADGRPVTWASAEPPGAVPGVEPPAEHPPGQGTVLGLRRWRGGTERRPLVLGSAHPHGTHLTLL